MDLSYLYLFVDFYLNKYNRKTREAREEVRAFKEDWVNIGEENKKKTFFKKIFALLLGRFTCLRIHYQ